MIIIKTSEEIEKMRRVSRVVAETLQGMKPLVRPGVTTGQLDEYAEKALRDRGVEPAFKGYRGYPSTICASKNEIVVHGIPSEEVLEEGDIISVDLGGRLDGFYGDSAVTFPVGEVSGENNVSSGGFEVFSTATLSLRRAVDSLVDELSRVTPSEVESVSGTAVSARAVEVNQ